MEKEKTFEKKNRKVKPQAISINLQEKTKCCPTRKIPLKKQKNMMNLIFGGERKKRQETHSKKEKPFE